MPRRPANTPPKYRLHRASGRAFVHIEGKRIYLGKHGSPESLAEYKRVIAEWSTKRRAAQIARQVDPRHALTLAELVVEYSAFVETHYRKDGKPTSEVENTRQALKFLAPILATLACEFGPMALEETRERMVAAGRSRPTINRDVHRVRRMFKWASSRELLDVAVYQKLCTLAPLRRGRTEAPEPPPVRAVPDDVVEATLPKLPPIVADMVRLQRLTGMRPGELVIMRPCDIDRGGDVWAYMPASHKLEHHGLGRTIYLGPRAVEILSKYLDREPEAFCFSPKESEAVRHADQRQKRKSKLTPSQRARRPKKHPKKAPRDRYDVASYRRAVTRAAAAAGVEAWAPNQLRHRRATEIRAKYGIEAARLALGHNDAATTLIYAEADEARAKQIALEMG